MGNMMMMMMMENRSDDTVASQVVQSTNKGQCHGNPATTAPGPALLPVYWHMAAATNR
jgi:hypothetical protein